MKEILGHKVLATTLRYAHMFPDRARKAVDRLSEGLEKDVLAKASTKDEE